MERKLFFYKCGSFYKVCSVPLTRSVNFNTDIEDIVTHDEKIYCNLIRARSHIRDIILCNDFYYFVTLTISPKYNRFDLDYFRRSINNKIRKLRTTNNKDLFYLLVPEKHKNGAWHMHGCFSRGFVDYMYVNKNGYLSCSAFDYLGFNSNSVIIDKCKISSYIQKYICKDFNNYYIDKGKHLYFCSHGLARPVLLDSYRYKNEKFDLQLFENSYCLFKIFDNKPKLPIKLLR